VAKWRAWREVVGVKVEPGRVERGERGAGVMVVAMERRTEVEM
jgi:hypothetical protein